MKKTNNENGYLLIEAMLSVFLLSIGFISVLHVFQKSVRATQYQKYYLEPARRLAETVLTKAELNLREDFQQHTIYDIGKKDKFRYKIVISDWPTASRLKQVQVVVEWTDRGRNGSYTLTTLLPVQSKSGNITTNIYGSNSARY